jgi:hypothetical protein
MTGSQQATMPGGNLSGSGTTINLGNLAWSGGKIGDSTGTVVNQGNLVWTGGNVVGSGGLTNQGSFTISGNGGQTVGYCVDVGWGTFAPGALTNAGTITHAADGVLHMVKDSTLNNLAGAVYDIQGDVQITGLWVGWGWPIYSSGGTINNAGLFRKSSGTGTAYVSDTYFNNTGTVEVDSGTLAFGNFSQTAGLTHLKSGDLAFSSPANILGGDVIGSGTIYGSIVNSGGLLSPEFPSEPLTIYGNYTQGADATLLIELAGLGNGQFDLLNVNGIASLDGTLEIEFLNGFHPAIGDTFQIMDFYSKTGDFASIQVLGAPGYQFATQYSGSNLDLVTEAVPEPASALLLVIGAALLRRKK